MGSYVGSASLVKVDGSHVADVRVSLSTADAAGERWFGYVDAPDDAVATLDGLEVVLELPSGTCSRARVVIDLTAEEPLVRLVGRGIVPA